MKHFLIENWARCASMAAGGLMIFLGTGCTAFEESGLPGSASSMARNQIMPVTASTQSFGHYRLVSLMRIYPDLDLFVSKRGMPDFMAETSNRKQQYFILYYLEDRQAFAARTRAPQRGRLEFSGPYPITDKEMETLKQLQTSMPSGGLVPRRFAARAI
jgi:hypothetical protein